MRSRTLGIVWLVLVAASPAVVAADNGHALAQQFSVAADEQDQRLRDEQEMLDAARAEAAARQDVTAPAGAATDARSNRPEVILERRDAEPAAVNPAANVELAPLPETEVKPIPGDGPPRGSIGAAIAPADAPAVVSGPRASRVTVLVALDAASSGLQRLQTTPDPIVCVDNACFVSAGPDQPAKKLPRSEAMSLSSAGACRDTERCVFRGIELDPGSNLQVVDLGVLVNDQREPVEARADKSCALVARELFCDNPITAPDYRVWLVPEDVARDAGRAELERALNADLAEPNITKLGDR